jgi:hypothetical protein
VVANSGRLAITVYADAMSADGDLFPDEQLVPLEGIPASLDYDARLDKLFVSTLDPAPAIFVFADVSSGGLSGELPAAGVITTKGVLTSPVGMYLDASGDLYVANADTATVLVYAEAAFADGETAVARTIRGNPAFTGLSDVFVDSRNRTYVVNSTGSPRVDIFRNASALDGDVVPDFTFIVPDAGTLTSIVVDSGGRGYIAESTPMPGKIYSYDNIATLSGAVPPTRTIAGAVTQLSGPEGLYLAE